MLCQYFCTSSRLPVLIFTLCKLPLCVWVWPCSSMQAPWHFYLTSSLQVCIAPQLGEGNPWILDSFLVPFFPPGSHLTSHLRSRPLKRPKSALLNSRFMSLLCALLTALRILNWIGVDEVPHEDQCLFKWDCFYLPAEDLSLFQNSNTFTHTMNAYGSR